MGLMYDRSFDNGQGQVADTSVPLDGSSTHVTQFDASNNTRVSWDTDGGLNTANDLHPTDQNLPYGHPNRHSWNG